MDGFLQRILDLVNHHVLANMTPDRRARKLAIVNTLAKGDREKVTPTPLNGIRALRFKRGDATSKKGDGEVVVVNTNSKAEEVETCKEEVRRISSVPVEVHAFQNLNERGFGDDFHTNLLMPSISATNLLEEIEADLPSSYSLANVLDHTLHSVTNLRTCARLSRVGMNCVQVEENVKNARNCESHRINRIKNLQKELFIQKTLIEQADKAVGLCKIRKKNLEVDDLESVRILLMAKLRYEAINLELQKLTYSGVEDPKEEPTGEMEISDIWFTVSDTKNNENDHFVCVVYHRDNLFASHVQSEVVNGTLHLPVNFKFDDMRQSFIVYLELYQLNLNAKVKKERTKVLDVKNLMKMATHKNKVIKTEQRDFECIGTGSMRMRDIENREKGKVSIDFHTGYYSPFGKTVSLNLRTRLFLTSTTNGFLDLFKDRCWHRLWCCPVGCALQFWCYPEDKDNEKAPVESVLLLYCQEDVQPVSLEVCIRPHSFMITYKETDKGLLLSASSHRDMMNWINFLRSAIRALEAWAPDF